MHSFAESTNVTLNRSGYFSFLLINTYTEFHQPIYQIKQLRINDAESKVSHQLHGFRSINNRHYPGFFWTPGSEPTIRQCHETSWIFTGNEWIFASAVAKEGMSSLFLKKKGSFLLFGSPQPLKKPKSFEIKPIKNDIPSIHTGKNPFGPREYPGRLVTLSKRGSRVRCSKIKPVLYLNHNNVSQRIQHDDARHCTWSRR